MRVGVFVAFVEGERILIVTLSPTIVSTDIDWDAILFQLLEAILDWLPGTHCLDFI